MEDTIKALDDFMDEIGYITLFNILHCEKPLDLLKSAYEILNKTVK